MCTPPTYTGVSVQEREPGQMRELSVFGKPPQMWDTKAVNKSNGMPEQMCSIFVKITKLSHEERFMRLLLALSFPRYFLSIPPQIKPSTGSRNNYKCAAPTTRIAKPLAAPRGLARNTARRVEQVFPPAVLARSEGHARATARHRWEPESAPHLTLAAAPSSGAGLATSSHKPLCPRLRIPAWEHLQITSLAMRRTLDSPSPFVLVMESLFRCPFEELAKSQEPVHLS